MFAAVETVIVTDEATGEEVDATHQVVAAPRFEGIRRHLDSLGYSELPVEERCEAPEVDFATQPRSMLAGTGRRVSVQRSVTLYEP